MIGYVTIGTNDLARAGRFYDDLLGLIGAKRVMESERYIGWGTGKGSPMLMVMTPFDGKPATVGNGAMVAFFAGAQDKVDALHAKTRALGGADEGAPGNRGGSFYGAYARDLDGNKICFFVM
ncbi:MAG: VOC family protein [Gammaproteobacteria bacterium]|nr:VOC family protein [Gammaproteobacteria bacterium]